MNVLAAWVVPLRERRIGTRAAPCQGMQPKFMSLVLGASLLASACATESGQGAAAGAVGGGLIGGLAGGGRGMLIGAALGSLLGYGVGKSIEDQDRREMAYAFEANQPMTWQNPDTGYRYQVEPTHTDFQRGEPCREFRMTADVGQQPREVYGTACRTPDGSWEIVNRD